MERADQWLEFNGMKQGSVRLLLHSRGGYKVREARRFDEMAKRKKRIATGHRKLGISISCRVQKSVLKDLDVYRKSLKLSRSAALVKLATDHLAGLKEPAEKMWEGAVEHMFPAGDGAKGDDP